MRNLNKKNEVAERESKTFVRLETDKKFANVRDHVIKQAIANAKMQPNYQEVDLLPFLKLEDGKLLQVTTKAIKHKTEN